MNVNFIQETLSRPPLSSSLTPALPWELLLLQQTPLISLLHGAICFAFLMLNSLNQQFPKMYYQPLPPYAPTIGYPKVHKADNGPPFSSKELRYFFTARGIRTKHSYPYHLRAECVMNSGGSRRKSGRGSTLQFWVLWVWCDDEVANYIT